MDHKEDIDENSILQKDILFKSPSGASSFVLGSSTSGQVEWKTADGRMFKEVESGESEEA